MELAKTLPAQATAAISLAVLFYMTLLKKRGVDITEKTSTSQTQIAQMDALIRQNGELQSRLIAVQNTLSDQLKATAGLAAKVEELEGLVRHYQRKCDTCPGPKGLNV